MTRGKIVAKFFTIHSIVNPCGPEGKEISVSGGTLSLPYCLDDEACVCLVR